MHLSRTEENTPAIDALASLMGGRVGLEAVLGDLNRRGRRGWAPGRAVHRALTWDAVDRRDRGWWPQGISTSADASATGEVAGRRLVAVTWYARSQPGGPAGSRGSRVTFLDLETRRYRHVLLVTPVLGDGAVRLEPLRIHAGGLVWSGRHLHVAATGRGFVSFLLDDVVRMPDGHPPAWSWGYRYVLPVRFTHRAGTAGGHDPLRYSFLSLDRAVSPPELVAGEYAAPGQSRRLVRFPLDPDSLLPVADDGGLSHPLALDEDGVVRTQGAVMARGRLHLTVSRGPWRPGSVYVGTPGAFRHHRWATPMGPEDLAYWPSTDLLWSVSEHPRRRWVYSMRRAWFDR